MFKKLICICLLLFMASSVAYSQTSKRKKRVSPEKLITALTKAKQIRGMFGDDGVYLFTDVIEIRRIVKLGNRAIPLLIAHLSDKREMPYLFFNVSRADETVTVGDVCYDLLVRIIVHNGTLFDLECEKEEYHDTPDDCIKLKYGGPEMKRNWLRAYKQGKVRYETENMMTYPE